MTAVHTWDVFMSLNGCRPSEGGARPSLAMVSNKPAGTIIPAEGE